MKSLALAWMLIGAGLGQANAACFNWSNDGYESGGVPAIAFQAETSAEACGRVADNFGAFGFAGGVTACTPDGDNLQVMWGAGYGPEPITRGVSCDAPDPPGEFVPVPADNGTLMQFQLALGLAVILWVVVR